MREIEVKAKLRNKNEFLEKAATLGIKFGQPYTQNDTTYESDLPKDHPDWNIFRIRKQNGKTILTMKYKASNRPRDNHEHESVIEDPDAVAAMLQRLRYQHSMQLTKTRQTASYEGLELCLDSVNNLGDFIEVEKLTDENADVDEVRRDLWSLLVKLGNHEEDRVFRGYDTLLQEVISSKR